MSETITRREVRHRIAAKLRGEDKTVGAVARPKERPAPKPADEDQDGGDAGKKEESK